MRKVHSREPLAAPTRNDGEPVSLTPVMSEDAAFLREQARRCRRLARDISTPDVVRTLTLMAKDYDIRAEKLEKDE